MRYEFAIDYVIFMFNASENFYTGAFSSKIADKTKLKKRATAPLNWETLPQWWYWVTKMAQINIRFAFSDPENLYIGAFSSKITDKANFEKWTNGAYTL